MHAPFACACVLTTEMSRFSGVVNGNESSCCKANNFWSCACTSLHLMRKSLCERHRVCFATQLSGVSRLLSSSRVHWACFCTKH